MLRDLDRDGRPASEAKAEIGTHLHPWVTPPHAEPAGSRRPYRPGGIVRATA